jgi:hypothetical protein
LSGAEGGGAGCGEGGGLGGGLGGGIGDGGNGGGEGEGGGGLGGGIGDSGEGCGKGDGGGGTSGCSGDSERDSRPTTPSSTQMAARHFSRVEPWSLIPVRTRDQKKRARNVVPGLPCCRITNLRDRNLRSGVQG